MYFFMSILAYVMFSYSCITYSTFCLIKMIHRFSFSLTKDPDLRYDIDPKHDSRSLPRPDLKLMFVSQVGVKNRVLGRGWVSSVDLDCESCPWLGLGFEFRVKIETQVSCWRWESSRGLWLGSRVSSSPELGSGSGEELCSKLGSISNPNPDQRLYPNLFWDSTQKLTRLQP